MIGTREICALLLAGGMGAGSVVAVQKAQPAVSKPRPKATAPKVQKSTQTAAQSTQITDCPTVGPVGSADLSPMMAAQTEPLAGFPLSGGSALSGGGGVGGGAGGGGGGGGGMLPDPSPVPGVPQPDTWVMLVAGFGFLGLALRRRKPAIDRAVD